MFMLGELKACYIPEDIQEANESWGANCGPVALAAILHKSVEQVRSLFPSFAAKPWASPTVMEGALRRACVTWEACRTVHWPIYGLAWLQVEGPWQTAGVPASAAYRHTHWVGVYAPGDLYIFDVNAGMWLPHDEWNREVMSSVVACSKKATGWKVRKTWRVQLA